MGRNWGCEGEGGEYLFVRVKGVMGRCYGEK